MWFFVADVETFLEDFNDVPITVLILVTYYIIVGVRLR